MDTASALNSAVTKRIFASSFLPPDLPNYWDIVATFAAACSRDGRTQAAMLTTEVAKLTMENMQVLHLKHFYLTKNLFSNWFGWNMAKAKRINSL